MMPNDADPPTLNTNTAPANYINNAEDTNQNQFKRLANNYKESKTQPAAYAIVISSNTPKLVKKSRRKRSTEYAILEPIDESALNALRKTYKDSLKEITLSPNESPEEALMRYNAQSIREALENANQQPMEIAAGGEAEEVKESSIATNVELRQKPTLSSQLSSAYDFNNNAQYLPVKTEATNQVNNGAFITYSTPLQQTPALSVAYKQQSANYNPNPNQEIVYNNLISKQNNPLLYNGNNKILTENPYVAIYNTLETVPYVDEYSVANQPYQLANQKALKTGEKMAKSIVYQNSYVQPQLTYGQHLSTPINKNLEHIYITGHQITDYGNAQAAQYGNNVNKLPTSKMGYANAINKNIEINSYTTKKQPQLESHQSPFENLMAIIKKLLAQCCNECKENILKGLDETFKQKHYDENKEKFKILKVNPYTNGRNKTRKEEDFELQQFITEMSEKGYDKAYLTKQHQEEHKDGKLNLQVKDEDEKLFYKNNQSHKRETILPQPQEQEETETENYVEKDIEEEEDEEYEKVSEEEVETEEVEPPSETEKPDTKVTKEEKLSKDIPNDFKRKEDKLKKETIIIVKKVNNLNTTNNLERDESTTHSVYALRGQFRSHTDKKKLLPLKQGKQGKQFDNYKSINKVGTTTTPKNSTDKDDKLEEILDILHDLSKHSKEQLKEPRATKNENSMASSINSHPSNITFTSSTTTTCKPLTAPLTASVIQVISDKQNTNSTNTLPRKIGRRRVKLLPKNRKLLQTATQLSNSNQNLETTK